MLVTGVCGFCRMGRLDMQKRAAACSQTSCGHFQPAITLCRATFVPQAIRQHIESNFDYVRRVAAVIVSCLSCHWVNDLPVRCPTLKRLAWLTCLHAVHLRLASLVRVIWCRQQALCNASLSFHFCPCSSTSTRSPVLERCYSRISTCVHVS